MTGGVDTTIIAAFAAVFLLNESLSMRLVVAAVLVIGGIGLAIAARAITASAMRRPARQ